MADGTGACVGGAPRGAHRTLRSRWRTASLAAGWPFPSDWDSEAVDRMCRAVVAGRVPDSALEELGAARARAGVGLPGALQDLAALHAVSTSGHDGLVSADPDAVPCRLVRATALGWAEVIAQQAVEREVEDPLTGLTTATYLRTRLREVYRAAHRRRKAPDAEYSLLTVTLTTGQEAQGYSRVMAMVLAADVLRSVFDSGETLSLLRESTAAVLAARDDSLGERCERVRRSTAQRLDADQALRVRGPVLVREIRLPACHEEACALLSAMP